MQLSRSLLGRLVWLLALLPALVGRVEAGPPEGNAVFIALPPETLPTGIGAGGFVLSGAFYSGGGLYWMPTVGTQAIGGVGAFTISRDGKTLAGDALDSRRLKNAAIWQGGTQWRTLGSIRANALPCDDLLSSALGASGNGTVVVGLAWDGCGIARAFRWEESTGVVSLGSLSGESTRANNVSADGRVVVGWEQDVTGFRKAAKWVEGRQELIVGPTSLLGEAYAANRDGTIIVGGGCEPGSLLPSAWTWTQGTGVRCFRMPVPSFAVPNRNYQLVMQEISDDGRVIGGSLTFGLEAQSVVWFDGEGVYLRDYLRAHGVPDAFEGWINTGFITGVSPDGRTLVGYGAGPRTFQGYMVLLPELDEQ